jgi:hypothetical protein
VKVAGPDRLKNLSGPVFFTNHQIPTANDEILTTRYDIRTRVKDGILETRPAFGVSNPALPLRVRRVLIPYGYSWIMGF